MNWGYKLLLTFGVFAGGMFFLIYRSIHVNYELVSKDYYKNELRYQDIIDGTKQANQLSSQIQLSQQDQNIIITMPQEMKNVELTGDIWFYCAWNEKNDRHFNFKTNTDGIQVLPKQNMAAGNYTVKFNWQSNNKKYYSEENFTVH